jgi:N-acetylglucosamine-6-phosphate deacetylase
MTITLANCNLFTSGQRLLMQDIVLDGERVTYVGASGTADHTDARIDMSDQWLAPGFLDLQVNGAGGALFQATPDHDSLRMMETALRKLGVTGFLPTLTASSVEITLKAAETVGTYIANGSQSVLGLNLEGPFINASKAGMASAEECKPFDAELLSSVVELVKPGKVYMTFAPENVSAPSGMRDSGAILAIGHTTASYDQTQDFFEHGINVTTHIFNAMTGISGRDPGVAGAVLDSDHVCSSLIADGYHVHPANARLAFARLGADRLFLISDGMPPLGSDVRKFAYGSNTVTEDAGRCLTGDGVLAGTAVSVGQGLQNFAQWLNLDVACVVPLATSTPAKILGLEHDYGRIQAGSIANFVVTDSLLTVKSTITRGDVSELR